MTRNAIDYRYAHGLAALEKPKSKIQNPKWNSSSLSAATTPATSTATGALGAGMRVFSARLHIAGHDHADRFLPTWNGAMAGTHLSVVLFAVVVRVALRLDLRQVVVGNLVAVVARGPAGRQLVEHVVVLGGRSLGRGLNVVSRRVAAAATTSPAAAAPPALFAGLALLSSLGFVHISGRRRFNVVEEIGDRLIALFPLDFQKIRRLIARRLAS
ncbi:MAG TPA: hypothetical protein VJ783_01290, partial [Pirellulales bacterium]|nr:hypothetical protein [Pirellulales bacterium]